jgi:PHS family inorganic phosphate transporter-like MFS transporter
MKEEEVFARLDLLSPILTSVSNFSVQYNFQAISVALLLMSTSYCTSTDDDCRNGKQAPWVTGTASATVFIGAIIGQLYMGYLGDILGRSQALKVTLALACTGAALSAIIPNGNPTSIYAIIIVCRFVLGVGVGGVYPLSATKAAEDSALMEARRTDTDEKPSEPPYMSSARAFFWQAPGAMMPWVISYLLAYSDNVSLSAKWRLLLGLGAVPAAFVVAGAIYEESLRASIGLSEKSQQIGKDEPQTADIVFAALKNPRHRRTLIATGGGWFIYDVCYYGVNLFGPQLLQSINDSDDDNVSGPGNVRRDSWEQMAALGSGIPSVLLTIYLLDKVSLKDLQVWGFVFIASMFFVLAALYDLLKENSPDTLFFFYILLLFSLSFGPNTTTFILPPQLFPANIRSSFGGISAAAGKFGAVVGAYLFGSVAPLFPVQVIMVISGLLALMGAVLSHYFIPRDKVDGDSMNAECLIDSTNNDLKRPLSTSTDANSSSA